MSSRYLSKPVLREGLRLGARAVPVAVLLSLALFYVLLLIPGLDSFARGVVLAVALPLLLCVPLLGWVAAERERAADARRALTQAASRDPVTGFLHAPVLAGMVERRRSTAAGEQGKGAFLIIDASQLGMINRSYGLEWHDEALRHVANAIKGAVRSTDLVGRTGTDAFGVYLGGASAVDALDVGERIRKAVAASYFAPDGVHTMIDVTVAGVTFTEEMNFRELYVQAMETLEDPAARVSTALAIARGESSTS